MKVKLHPNSSQEKIVDRGESYEIWIKEKAVDGKANEALLRFLKKHFKKRFKIRAGFTSRNKIVEIGN